MQNATLNTLTDSAINLAHLTHQVSKAKVLLDDVIEEGKRKAERVVKHGVIAAEDAMVDATYCIKRHPWQSVAAALGAGVGLGLLFGWMATKGRSRHAST